MSFSYDTNTAIGKVRAITGDIASASAVLSDEQINVFLSIQNNDILMSSAMALRTMAASKAMLARYKSAGNYSEDTRDIGKQLLAVAKDLEIAAQAIPAEAQVEVIYDQFSYQNILRNRILRNENLES